MKVECDKKDGLVLVRMEGEVDMSSSPKVREALSPYFTKKAGVKAIVVVLTDVNYMDSSGIATLVEALQNCKKSGMILRLAALSPAVQDVFELARLGGIFDIHKTIEEATEGL